MKSILAALMASITALFSFLSAGGMAQLKDKGQIYDYADNVAEYKELVDLEADENGDFTVLQFSDSHFTTGFSPLDIYMLTIMEEYIVTYSPDLVVMAGDMVDDGRNGIYNKQNALDTVADMFERNGQYWAFVPGNNDGRKWGESDDVTAYLSQYEHCLVGDDKEISGGAQYSIDVTADGEMTHSLVFLDSMDYDRSEDMYKYGWVLEDQVKWVEDEIASKQAENPDVKISVFMHENTPNFQKAAADGKAAKGMMKVAKVSEEMDIPKNQPLDDVFAASGAVGLVSIGHHHPIAPQCSFYNDTYYNVSARPFVGSTLITIHTDAADMESMYEFQSLPGFSLTK